jgi:hypothetical protein
MQIELTIQVHLPDVQEQDGKVYSIGYSEEDIVDAVADLDYTFTLEKEKLDTQIIEISANDQTIWSL